MRKWKIITSAVLCSAALLALTGCRTSEAVKSGGSPVPGLPDLYRICDGPMLIYVTSMVSDQPYQWFYPGGCVEDSAGRWVFNTEMVGAEVDPEDGPGR